MILMTKISLEDVNVLSSVENELPNSSSHLDLPDHDALQLSCACNGSALQEFGHGQHEVQVQHGQEGVHVQQEKRGVPLYRQCPGGCQV